MFGGGYKGTEMRSVFAAEIQGVTQRQGELTAPHLAG